MDKVGENCISGFRRRLVALFIDALILGTVGFILGSLFESIFVQIGDWGKLFGLSIATMYFGVMNSVVCNGQTLGKKLLNIRVVNKNNHSIDLTTSFIRYIIFSIPFYLNGTSLDYLGQYSFLMYPLSLLVFGGLISITYLYVFNRVTRQTLHDLIMKTYVVKANTNFQSKGIIWKPHLYIVGLILVASMVTPYFILQSNQNNDYDKLLAVSKTMQELPYVNDANVTLGEFNLYTTKEVDKSTTYINIQVFLDNPNIDDVVIAKDLGKIAVNNYSESINKDSVNVTLIYGYDLGVWSKWFSHTHQFSPLDLLNEEAT
ncbi:RDD family protein [Photobacterium makurazakiensis]|uniref:RDD family protein n=1 Tax=Photobacterium makurazakiensis TaxID=2910234 RepID=UPI003D11B7F6